VEESLIFMGLFKSGFSQDVFIWAVDYFRLYGNDFFKGVFNLLQNIREMFHVKQWVL
jgi:hypothetical protein